MARITRVVQVNDVTFKITSDTGETPEHYANLIAEALALEEYYTNQAQAFMEQANNERKKAHDRTCVLFTLKEYNRAKKRDESSGQPRKVSRMDPMLHYDEQKLSEERNMLLARANEFHKTSDNFTSLAQKQRELIVQFKSELQALRDSE